MYRYKQCRYFFNILPYVITIAPIFQDEMTELLEDHKVLAIT